MSKCEFEKATVTYLGTEVGQGKVQLPAAKISAVAKYPVPTTKRQQQHFLGLAGYFTAFCRKFATIVSPLTDLFSSARKLVWDSKCNQAFQAVKAVLCNSPVLAAPNLAVPFKLEVDASGTGASAVLIQEDSAGIDHPVCYFSKNLSQTQQNYNSVEKEALALLWANQGNGGEKRN